MNIEIFFLLVIILIVSITLLELSRAIKKTLNLLNNVLKAIVPYHK